MSSLAEKTRIQSIPLSDTELDLLLDRLDASEEQSKKSERRSEDRFPYRKRTTVIEFKRPEGSMTAFLVPTRNLSRNGMCVLHSGFVHEETRCEIQLVTTHNMWQTVEGIIRWCRYVEGRIHHLGIRFDQPIDVAAFCPQAVSRRVLFVDDDPSTHRLAAHHLAGMNVEVTTAENGTQGVEKAFGSMFDCILMDIDMPEMDGFEALAELRKRGYGGKVVACTAMTGDGDQERLLEAGFDHHIKKPLTRPALENLFSTLNEEPIFSTMSEEPGMKELIAQFVEELPNRCKAIETAVVAESLADLERAARNLKGEAGGYGFDPITDAAGQIEVAIRAKSDGGKIKKLVADLRHLCTLVRPPNS